MPANVSLWVTRSLGHYWPPTLATLAQATKCICQTYNFCVSITTVSNIFWLPGIHLFHPGLVVRSKARRPPSFGPRLPLTNKVRYIISGSRWGERGKMCPFKGTEGKKHLRSSGKGPQKWETGGAEPPGPGGLTSPCSSVHARRELERDWCAVQLNCASDLTPRLIEKTWDVLLVTYTYTCESSAVICYR